MIVQKREMHILSVDNNNSRQNFSKYPTWPNVAVVVLISATISGGAIGYGVQKEQIRNLQQGNQKISRRLLEVERWQKEWPLHGELIMDREQNSKLKELTGRLDRIEKSAVNR